METMRTSDRGVIGWAGAFVREHRLLVGFGVVIAIALAAVVVFYFEPQQLFIDERVDEALPTAAPTSATNQAAPTTLDTPASTASVPAVTAPAAAPAEPRLVSSGRFRSLAHETSGVAEVQQLTDGSRVVRLDEFRTENGPDLRVYLVAGGDGMTAQDFVDLGALKGNIGSQNYSVPANTDLARYGNVVIWCRRFSVGFGVAKLG